MKNLFSIFPFILLTLIISAQNSDSGKVIVKTPVAEYFLEQDFFPNNSSFFSIDSSLNGIQKYFPNNFLYGLGLSNRKLFFIPSSEIGFRSGTESLDLFGYNRSEIKYYRARTPYTEIFALFGQKKEQYAKLLHTQNITKQWNISLNMLRLRSEGFYNRQICTDNNISLSTNYTSKSNRYSFLANGFISSIKTDENGGVSDDTIFENNLLANKKLIAVNLSDARTRRGNREFTVIQFLNFGKRDTSAKTDSTSKKIIPRSYFSYSFHANENWFAYEDKDPSSGFYSTVFYDSTLTHDSTHIFSFSNAVALKSYLFKNVFAELSFQQKTSRLHQYYTDSISLRAIDTLFNDDILNISIGKNIRDNSKKGFYWNIAGEYIVNGSNNGDYFINGNFAYVLKNKQRISFTSENVSHSVPFIYSQYISNHFLWGNSFDKETTSKNKISFIDSKHQFILSADMTQIINYVYLDSTCKPVTYNGRDVITLYSVLLKKNFNLKHFGFNNKITWQSIYAAMKGLEESAIHLPEFVTHHSLFYKGQWFKKATDVQFGCDVTYFSAYYADAYMPALGLYYWQNEKKIGNYPFIDFFFNLKVKHARFFFKTEHVNSGFMGGYYLAPHHPAPDRSLKVGINWTFYD